MKRARSWSEGDFGFGPDGVIYPFPFFRPQYYYYLSIISYYYIKLFVHIDILKTNTNNKITPII